MAVIDAWSLDVRIGTVSPAWVRDTSIQEESRSPITKIDFTVEDAPVSRDSFDAALLNAEVEVTLTNAGRTRNWLGRIVDITIERGPNYTQAKVTVHTLETLARRRRVFGEYSGRVDDVVRAVWNDWGTWLVAGTNVESLGEHIEISPSWDSLFNVIDEIARRFDYAWNLDPVAGELRFFDPLNQPGDTINQDSTDIVGSSLTVKRNSEDLVNSILVSGWIFRDITGSADVRTEVDRRATSFGTFINDCLHSAHMPEVERLMGRDEWELVGGRMLKDWGDPPPDREFTIRGSGWVTFDPPLVPLAQATEDELREFVLTARWAIRFRKLVNALVENQESINKFGRREGEPITEDGGQTIEESRERGQVVVDSRAWPTLEVDCDLTRLGPEPDTVATVNLTDPKLSRDLFVESVNYTVRGAEMSVDVSLSTPDPDATTVEG